MSGLAHQGNGNTRSAAIGVPSQGFNKHSYHRLTVPPRSIACPDCGANVGEHCVKANGDQRPGEHRSRVRLRVRAHNEQRPTYSVGTDEPLWLLTGGAARTGLTHATRDERPICGARRDSQGSLHRGVLADIDCKRCMQELLRTA